MAVDSELAGIEGLSGVESSASVVGSAGIVGPADFEGRADRVDMAAFVAIGLANRIMETFFQGTE